MKQKGFVAANDSNIDAKTKLPTRIIHRASGIALVLFPAVEFWMGSPETEAKREKIERRNKRIVEQAFYLGQPEVTVGQFRL